MDLFSTAEPFRPLADRMRPAGLDELVGQRHLLAEGKPLRRAIAEDRIHSMVLWGPPGTGKTTLARLLAQACGAHFIAISAVLSGVKEIRSAIDQARQHRTRGAATILFVDEAHRFNKAQQDAFLPHIEDGTLHFVGATTENPSFELNNALLSRLRVYVLQPLAEEDIATLLDRALRDAERGLGARSLRLEAAARQLLAAAADGDARRGLSLLEIAADLVEDGGTIGARIAAEVGGQGLRRFDRHGDAFYDQISALHKSVRGSDPDAALYWLARMLDGGCDPTYIARRLLRMASEDIGNADPRALRMALDAWDAYLRLGSPEGELALAQAVVYLACLPKSNAVYQAFGEATADARSRGSLEVPLELRNAPTGLMRELGHGEGYRYAHDEPDGFAAGARYFPAGMPEARYYRPQARGLEQAIAERLEQLRERNRRAREQ